MTQPVLRIAILSVSALLGGFAVILGLTWLVNQALPFDRVLALATNHYVNALTLGSIYALIALGYTMVYGIIELINFAHGDVFMVGAFVAYLVFTTLGLSGAISAIPLLIGVLLLGLIVSMVTLGLLGVAIERFAYRPLRNAPRLAPLITAIGVSFILQNVVQVLISNSPVPTPQLISNSWRFSLLGASIAYLNLLIFLTAIVLMIGLQLFVGTTRLGRAMRSTAQDREAAQLMGVDINQTIAITFFIGSALAGAGGVVYGLFNGTIVFNLGFEAGLKAFTAAVLGGIGNTVGAALGGLLIGFIQVAAVVVGLSRWQQALVFAVLIVVLVFRPSGLLGQQIGERA